MSASTQSKKRRRISDWVYTQYMKRVPRDKDPITLSDIPKERIFCHTQPSGHISQLDCASLLDLCKRDPNPTNPLTRHPFSTSDLLRLHVQCKSLGLIDSIVFPSLRVSYGKNAATLQSFIKDLLVMVKHRLTPIFARILLHVLFALDSEVGIYFFLVMGSALSCRSEEEASSFWKDGLLIVPMYGESAMFREFVLTESDPSWFSSTLEEITKRLKSILNAQENENDTAV